MTHSHCVRSNPAKVVGPNPTRSIFIQHVVVLTAYFVPENMILYLPIIRTKP